MMLGNSLPIKIMSSSFCKLHNYRNIFTTEQILDNELHWHFFKQIFFKIAFNFILEKNFSIERQFYNCRRILSRCYLNWFGIDHSTVTWFIPPNEKQFQSVL